MLLLVALACLYGWLGLDRVAYVTAIDDVRLFDAPDANPQAASVGVLSAGRAEEVAGCIDLKSDIVPFVERGGRRFYLVHGGRYDFRRSGGWTFHWNPLEACPFPDFAAFGHAA